MESSIMVFITCFLMCWSLSLSSSTPGGFDNKFKRSSLSNRETEDGQYAPIRIRPYFLDLEIELETSEIEKLKSIVNRVISYTKKILQVIPVTGPLLLNRSGCRSKWREGPNKNRCSLVKRSYSGEKCLNFFSIPQQHLEGLALWSRNGSDPYKTVYPSGEGLHGTDIVLYIQSLTTARCQLPMDQTIIAYASYCQLGDNDRPVAGYMNICPGELRALHLDDEKLFWICLHELFHVLGFSKDLFHKFKDCRNPDRCWSRGRLFYETSGLKRLVTPAVVEESRLHFGCTSTTEFGIPLQLNKEGQITSHWDAKFMQGSIMAPHLDKPHLTSVDRMTLAVLEDSSWYKVNYSMADTYMWGKNGGCSFGLACNKSSEFFCTGRIQGCHYLHVDKAECTSNQYLGGCRIFQALPNGHCTNTVNMSSSVIIDPGGTEDVYSSQSRCFLSNMTSYNNTSDLFGRCYIHRCRSEKDLDVHIPGSGWHPCLPGETIEVPAFNGMLICPEHPEFICLKSLGKNDLLTEIITVPNNVSDNQKTLHMNVYIHFTEDDYKEVASELGDIVVTEVLSLTNIHQHRIKNVTVDKGVVFFQLFTGSENETSSAVVYATLVTAVQNELFMVVSSSGHTYWAIDVRKTTIEPKTPNRHQPSPVIPVTIAIGFSILVPLTLVMTVIFIRKKLECSGSEERKLQKSSYEDISMTVDPGGKL
ncbi:hypothetical protein ScPMuIL_014775 [Solemya velum]